MKTMNTPKQSIIILAACSLLSTGLAEPEKAEPALRLTLDLIDGSHIIGTPAIGAISVEASLAMMDIQLERLVAVKMAEDHQNAAIDLVNGDKVTGVIKLEPITLETLFGKVSVGLEKIQTVRVVMIGGPPPAGEGPLAFGGVNWTPWRTQFEVRGDKLVSLPAAQQGFNYGHSGNGRGATLVTNIGSAEWKDYSVEFELGMNGVDPAFNPFLLGQDFRSASIGFHVTDAKESWNERGGSGYGLSLGGDGTWSLGCGYNVYCKTPVGYGNPTSDGSRTLAEGKGLKPDPVNGNKVRIEVCGTRIRIWVDGEKIADLRDEKMGECIGGQTLDHGGVAFTWGFESMGWIRNFSAKRL
jgi:hypothetical protein